MRTEKGSLLAATQPMQTASTGAILVRSHMDRSPRLRIKVPSLCKQIMTIQKCVLFACKTASSFSENNTETDAKILIS